MFTELIKNSAVLIALSVLFGLLSRKRISGLPAYKIVEGLLYGGIVIVAMEMTVYHPAGYIYDGRSIVIALAGFLGGSITAGISVAIAWIYRIYLGGSGVWVGTLTMLISAMIGLLFRYLSPDRFKLVNVSSLLGLGIVVHLFMLACQLILPGGLQIIEQIWLPIMFIFPMATLMMGLLIGNEEKRLSIEKTLQQSEENFKHFMDESPLGMHVMTEKGKTLYANRAFLNIYGFNTIEEYIKTPSEKRYTPESFKQHQKRKEKRIKGEHVDPEYEREFGIRKS
jgi:PAS domain S-box-containing protein